MACAEHVYNFGYEWYIIISLLDTTDQCDRGAPHFEGSEFFVDAWCFPWKRDASVPGFRFTQDRKQKRKMRRHAHSPRMKFECMMTESEVWKTIKHTDHVENVIGECYIIGAVK